MAISNRFVQNLSNLVDRFLLAVDCTELAVTV